jgi:anthranilate synthase component 1
VSLLGSSPETLVKVEDGRVLSRPIAGTRPRGRSNQEDHEFEQELVKDEKELAEHIMLVDLARNDVGRVCTSGSVSVTDLLCVERYARVMHITSNVSGTLHKKYDAFDVLAATFPAGTVSGAPKIRAMEIIDELEPVKRGFYAGAIGYFGYNGDMDFCIAIRTIMMHNKIAYLQGGAGIVADSNPEKEYVETLDKMSALKSTLEIAQ